jgi:excisionase family DNA binding protein
MDFPDLITVAEAADELGVTPRTIQRRIQRGEIEAEMPGTEWLIPRRELDEYREHRDRVPA